MATLESPGVQVQVIDESFYTPAAPGTVPMVFVATAQDKTNPSGSTALGTTAANAGKVWLVTSQRDLTDTFGTPNFLTDNNNNPLHGNELNEYGLQAAYSLLGASSRCYIVRSGVDLSDLVPASSEPTGTPVNGTFWVDTDASLFGIHEYNTATNKFTLKTPIVLDDNATTAQLVAGVPTPGVGQKGEYCLVLTNDNENKLYFKDSGNAWIEVEDGFDGGKSVEISPHYNVPNWTSNTTDTGSVWIKTTEQAQGAKWSVKRYNSSTRSWDSITAPMYTKLPEATKAFDTTGGKSIPVNTVFVEANYDQDVSKKANFKVWRRNVLGVTNITGATATAQSPDPSYVFEISESIPGSSTWGPTVTITINPVSASSILASLIPQEISGSSLNYVIATWDSVSQKLTLTHTEGGEIRLTDGSGSPLSLSGFSAFNLTTNTGTPNLYASYGDFDFIATNWKPLSYEATVDAPTTTPADGTLWYSSMVDEVDIMVHDGTTWVGYKNQYPNTDPNGPIISVVQPTEQSDGSALVANDIWISTDNLDNYGRDIYVYDGATWILQDTTDQSTPDGWLFADARWATAGSATDSSSILSLLESDYLDPDAPDPALYPRGMRLWNTRRSGFNVKKYVSGHINIEANDGQNIRYNDESMAGYATDRWVSQYPTAEDGGPQFGRKSQRAQVVNAMKELIDSNTTIRDTDSLNFNLIAAPGYPEVIQNMIAFNTDRGLTAFVLGDTPFRLQPTGTALSEWGNNTAKALDNGEEGATSFDEYMAMYYPSGYTNDNTGNRIVVPPSHMMLRTIINSDAKSYPWFAPAGLRRGGVDNASSVGYITAEGEFATVSLYQGLRDVLDDVKINPIATLTGSGLIAYGQRTRARAASALDRINVARLVCYLRRQLDIMARPFLFEPNDAQTRREIKAAAESLLLELVGQRALYDFIVVCDETNNTPARIDRNELYVDIAVEPVKAIEFIYIPLRLKNTGDIAAGL